MQFHNSSADLFVPDGLAPDAALARTTHLAISAHQDDIEIMAYHGIAECFGRKDKWFTGVVATNGAGSPRSGIYGDSTDEEMQKVRLVEQRKAAYVGEYACQIQLGFTSSQVKDPHETAVVEDLERILRAARPEFVYLHNLADKHDTHVAVALRSIAALRAVRQDVKPEARLRLRSVARSGLAAGRRQAGPAGFRALQHRRRAGGRLRFAGERRQALRPGHRRPAPGARHLLRLARHRRRERPQLRHGPDAAGGRRQPAGGGLRPGSCRPVPRGRGDSGCGRWAGDRAARASLSTAVSMESAANRAILCVWASQRTVERPFRLPRRRPCRRSSKNAGTNTGMAGATPAPRCSGSGRRTPLE